MKTPRRILRTIVVVLLGSLLAGCANLPDIKPFADATALMATTLRKGYSQDEALMLRAIDVTSDDTSAKLTADLQKLKKAWQPTEDALNALAEYSDSLAALADAGKKGKDTSDAFFKSLNGLLGTVSALTVPANIVAIAGTIGREIAALKAEKDLKKAVNSVADIISRKDGIADLLAQNFAELKRLNDALGNDIEGHLMVSNQSLINYHDRLMESDLRVQRILTEILEFELIATKFREASQRAAAARSTLEDLKRSDAGLPGALSVDDPNVNKTLEARRAELLNISKSYRGELDRVAADYKVANDKITQIRELTRSGDDIFDKSQKAVKAWAKAHNDLRLALEKRQKRVTVLGLLSIVSEIASDLEKGGK